MTKLILNPGRAHLIAFVVVVVAILAGTLALKQLHLGGAASVNPPTLMEKNTLKLLNIQRAKYGLSKLTYSSTMAKLARAHTADMIKRNYFNHDAPGGPTYRERMSATLHSPGIRRLEENIAFGYSTAAGLVNGWMSSPGHRANILSSSVNKTGLGIQLATNFQGASHTVVATDEFSN